MKKILCLSAFMSIISLFAETNLDLDLAGEQVVRLALSEDWRTATPGQVLTATAEGFFPAALVRTADGYVMTLRAQDGAKAYAVTAAPGGVKVRVLTPKKVVYGEKTAPAPQRKTPTATQARAQVGPSTVDVLLAFDESAEAWLAESGERAEDFARKAIADMNQVLANTGITNSLSYRLAGVHRVAKNLEGLDINLVVDAACGPVPGAVTLTQAWQREAVWQQLRAARDAAGADVVSVLSYQGIDRKGGLAGIGFSLGTGWLNDAGFAAIAANAVAIEVVESNLTLAHEVGHNMGAGHASADMFDPGNAGPGLYAYSNGYYLPRSGDDAFCTVMGYDDNGLGDGIVWDILPYFSTPNRRHAEVAVGDATHDNARTLAQTAAFVSQLRSPKTKIDVVATPGGSATVMPAGGAYAAGTKLTLRATPSLTHAFVGWYGVSADGTVTNALEGVARTASAAYVVGAESLTILARFVAKADDAKFAVTCAADPEGYAAGAALALPVTSDSITPVSTLMARGLPLGLRVDVKTMTLLGTPTKPGVYTVDFTAKNAAMGAGTGSVTIKVKNFVDAEAYPNLEDAYGPFVPGDNLALDFRDVVSADSLVAGLPMGLRWDKAKLQVLGAATKPGSYTVTFSRMLGGVKRTASATFTVGPLPVVTVATIGDGKGTAAGAGAFAANKKVALRATPALNNVFAGWYVDRAATTPAVGAVDYRTANFQYLMTTNAETTLYARFIPKAADTNVAVVCAWPKEGVAAGAAVKLPVEVVSETLPKVTVVGLPMGLKFDPKTLEFTGAATKPGVYQVTIKAQNASGFTSTQVLDVKVQNFVSPEIPVEDAYPVEMVGVDVELKSEAFRGCLAQGLPMGLKLVGDTISGAPTKAGSYTVIFTKGAAKASSTFTVLPLPSSVAATFVGSAQSEASVGSATMTVAAAGRISGKILIDGATWTFAATGFDASSTFGDGATNELVIAATAKAGLRALPLTLTLVDGLATGSLGSEDEMILIEMRATVGRDRDSLARVKPLVGVYTVSLECEESGYGYLSLTVDANANVKMVGKAPDGTALSLTAPLALDGAEALAYVYSAPVAYKGGCLSGVIRFVQTPTTVEIESEGFTWTSKAVDASADYGLGFDRLLGVTGAWYNKLGALASYYTTMAFAADLPILYATIREKEDGKTTSYVEEIDAAEPDCWSSLTVSVNGTRFVVDQGPATRPVLEDGDWYYEGANDAALTYAFTQATGLFKGSFAAWYDYVSAVDWDLDKETVAHLSKTFAFEGIAVQGDDVLMRGFFLNEAIGTYEDAAGNEKTFKYKQSLPVAFDPVGGTEGK